MARTLNNLTDRQIKASLYKGKDQKLFDGGGLYLLVNKGGKYWRFKYRYLGKEKLTAIGVYPQISLADARKKRDSLKNLLSEGLARIIHDPPTARGDCLILPALCNLFRPQCASAHCRPKEVTKHL